MSPANNAICSSQSIRGNGWPDPSDQKSRMVYEAGSQAMGHELGRGTVQANLVSALHNVGEFKARVGHDPRIPLRQGIERAGLLTAAWGQSEPRSGGRGERGCP
jgi:hypothetical protein